MQLTGASDKTSNFGHSKWHCVHDYKYLRVHNVNLEISARRANAWVAARKMERIWRSKTSHALKRSLVKALIEPILLYGCEASAFTLRQERALRATLSSILRYALRVKRKADMSCDMAYMPSNCLPTVETKKEEH